MILIDFSSILHRMVHTSVGNSNPAKVDGKYITEDFAGLMKYYIMNDLFGIQQEHGPTFGELVICLDKSDNGYWRNDVYSGYKSNRKKTKDESEVNFDEIFVHVNELLNQIKMNLPWKIVEIPRAEADDLMLVLAREYSKHEKVLIHSPDKDMIQAQRNTENVFQWSALTKKWLKAETKSADMNDWVLEHVCLGDASDGVPKVVDCTEFTDVFINYLASNRMDVKTPIEFREHPASTETKSNLIYDFQVYKTNRKGVETDLKDVYKQIRFGPAALKKKLKEHGTLDNWLDSHPMYRDHYNRNFTLVMEEGIPSDIWNESILQYKEASTEYNMKNFENYLVENKLNSIVMELPNYFKMDRELTAADFDW